MKLTTKRITLIITGLLLLIVLAMWGLPLYHVYQQRKSGEAKLAEANSSRQVKIAEAKAQKESAEYLAEADTIRAHGVATANKIIGNSLRGNEAYLKWLWIDNIEKNPNAVIYIPTENGMPIMESQRLTQLQQTSTQPKE